MTHTGYTIQMKVKNIKIHLIDGSSLAGEIFVSEYSPHHAGEEKISEYFEEDTMFFPFRTSNNLILFSKNFIVCVEFPTEDDLSIYNRVCAQIVTTGSKVFSLYVPISVPNPAARLSDQINLHEKFLLCTDETNSNTFLINKTHIVSLTEKKQNI